MKTIRIFIGLLLATSVISCQKYLDQKPSKNIAIPSTLSDVQAILDNNSVINRLAQPEILESVADNYYVTSAIWLSRPINLQLNYNWDKAAMDLNSYRPCYFGPIYYANVAMDALAHIDAGSDQATWNALRGSALFYRSFSFFNIAQLYCRPYSTTASTDLGIVLKLSGDVNEKIFRSTVQQTYDQIIADLKAAVDLLPVTTIYPTRPNKAAAYGMLARVYLAMSDYVNSGNYANLALQQNSTLLDYNTQGSPFPQFNKEMSFYDVPLTGTLMTNSIVDSTLYQSYAANDLRKTVFFKSNGNGTYKFNGSYYATTGYFPFDGIANDEIYLIRAESFARNGNVSSAMSDLNTLMLKRWKTGTFVPITATDANDAKNKILVERRKELLFRALRWTDLRRLNLEGANITLTRIVNGVKYTLPPNDLRWVMLIPQEEIDLSGIPQNPR